MVRLSQFSGIKTMKALGVPLTLTRANRPAHLDRCSHMKEDRNGHRNRKADPATTASAQSVVAFFGLHRGRSPPHCLAEQSTRN